MALSCSFNQIIQSDCCGSSIPPSEANFVEEIIPLDMCKRDIQGHKKFIQLSRSEVATEAELILARAGIFDFATEALSTFNVCARHRHLLGIGWRGRSKYCQVPSELTNHKGKPPIGDRTINKGHSRQIHFMSSKLVPVGAAICRGCRDIFKEKENEDQNQAQGEESKCPRQAKLACYDKFQGFVCETPDPCRPAGRESSLYVPGSCEKNSTDDEENEDKRLSLLNDILKLSGKDTITRVMKVPWETACEKTKNFYVEKVCEVLETVTNILCPDDPEMLFLELQKKAKGLHSAAESIPNEFLQILIESYKQSDDRQTRRQLLSIVADKLKYEDLKLLLPNLTEYEFSMARLHQREYGRGTREDKETYVCRDRVAPEKLDHFLDFVTSSHVIQDLPFGMRSIKLSSGEVLDIPNVICLMAPTHLVQQYHQYCQETEFQDPLKKSTLMKVLSEACLASIRKCLQGLDYYVAEGGKAFDDLQAVVDRLLTFFAVTPAEAENLKKSLKIGKQYVKSEFKTHVVIESDCASHCRKHALSDQDQTCFRDDCCHKHDLICERCEGLAKVLDDRICTTTKNVPEDELDEIIFVVSKAVDAIKTWKAHQLRVVHQDQARLDVIDQLCESKVLITQDFAMKFMPIKFREAQNDFFGKRGLSWHVSVVLRRNTCGQLESQSFIHILESGLQDSQTVVPIMAHVLSSLKTQHPEVKEAFYRMDNAGCYHSATTILACKLISERSGITIRRMDFSDPQGGKGPADRKSAQVKCHVKAFINQGNSVTKHKEFESAILSRGGIKGVRVAVVNTTSDQRNASTLTGISHLNNFSFSDDGVTAHRAYDVGKGKFLPWPSLEVPSPMEFKWIETIPSKGDFFPVHSVTQDSSNGVKGSDNTKEESQLFMCPEGCCCTFQKYDAFQNHILYGRHEQQPKKITLLDKAKQGYARRLYIQYGAVPSKSATGVCRLKKVDEKTADKGWALQRQKANTRFSKKQKEYLQMKFEEGVRTGNKHKAEEVAQDMRTAKEKTGKRLFTVEEFLTSKQIASFFSRLAAKRRNVSTSDNEAISVEEVRKQACDAMMGALSSHPLTYENLVLCGMTKQNLTCLKLEKLKAICKHLGICGVTGRKKVHYVDKLLERIEICQCRQT